MLLTVHYKEIIDFLSTVTIKNSYFAEVIKDHTIQVLGLDTLDDKNNPYYLNLIGEYSVFDEPMYVRSLDTLETILFSKETLEVHPKTKLSYSIKTDFYKNLCIKYPTQKDLIKSIRYPVDSIEEAIMADDFTVLQYDTSTLDSNEVNSMIGCLLKTVHYINHRWYIKQFNYEEYYPIIFWMSMWMELALELLVQRTRNIKTNKVHLFYIIEYLNSKGLNDFIPFLNRSQLMFLYQNIDYLSKNKGKEDTFEKLIDNLFREIGGNIKNKTIYLSKKGACETLTMVPVVVSSPLDKGNFFEITDANTESFEDFVTGLYSIPNIEPDQTKRHLDNMKSRYALQPRTKINTKFLEISDSIQSGVTNSTLIKFIYDSFFYLAETAGLDWVSTIENKYQSDVVVNVGEAIALMEYCLLRMSYKLPTIIPSIYNNVTAFKTPPPSLSDINMDFLFQGKIYQIDSYLPVSQIYTELYKMPSLCKTSGDFSDLMAQQVPVLYGLLYLGEINGDIVVIEAINALIKQLRVDQYTTCSLIPGFDKYTDWLGARDRIKSMIDKTEASTESDDTKWAELLSNVTNSVIDLKIHDFSNYGSISATEDFSLYGLKNLLVYLCSYNICVLDRPYDKSYWYELCNLKFHIDGGVSEGIVTEEVGRISQLSYDFSDSMQDQMEIELPSAEVQQESDHYSEHNVVNPGELHISSQDEITNTQYIPMYLNFQIDCSQEE
ncbi:MAG: hypothetical protein GY804_09480 [Alphaproteobacteria bacterium]|nr:hypothetical protein [Alphaproteobacteria bacterium]